MIKKTSTSEEPREDFTVESPEDVFEKVKD